MNEPLAHDDVLPRATDSRDGIVILLARTPTGRWKGTTHLTSGGVSRSLDVDAPSSREAWRSIDFFVRRAYLGEEP